MDDTQLEANSTQDVQEATQQAVALPDPDVERRAQEIAQERNFKQLREQNEEYARRLQDAERRARELEQKLTPHTQENQLADDDFVDVKYLHRTKQETDERVRNLEQQLVEYSIRAECPDFYSVVTKDNVELLVREYPELAAVINNTQDYKAKAVSTYTLIKKFGLNNTKTESDKIQKNATKPKVSNAIAKSDSDLTQAHAFEQGLDEAEKAARYKLMKKYANNAQ